MTDDAAGKAYVENFALKVFVGADNEDRAGKATRCVCHTLTIQIHANTLKRPIQSDGQEVHCSWQLSGPIETVRSIASTH